MHYLSRQEHNAQPPKWDDSQQMMACEGSLQVMVPHETVPHKDNAETNAAISEQFYKLRQISLLHTKAV